jgi:Transport protein particle (TRAPP) component
MISDVDLMVNKYVSVPKDMGGLNCAAFVAGIVKGALDNAGFPARCVAKPWLALRPERYAAPTPAHLFTKVHLPPAVHAFGCISTEGCHCSRVHAG